MTEITPQKVFECAADLKERCTAELDKDAAASAGLGIDILAAFIVKIMLCEEHLRDMKEAMQKYDHIDA